MTQIASEDYPNKLIYLHVDTVTAGFDPAIMQQEHRALRRLNAGGERGYDPMVSFSGNEAKGGGKFTPALTLLRAGVRLVPFDTDHSLDLLGEVVNIPDAVGDRDAFDRSGVTSNVDIDPVYSPVEIREVATGGALTPTQDTRIEELWQDRGFDISNPVTVNETTGTVTVAGIIRTWAGAVIKTFTRS